MNFSKSQLPKVSNRGKRTDGYIYSQESPLPGSLPSRAPVSVFKYGPLVTNVGSHGRAPYMQHNHERHSYRGTRTLRGLGLDYVANATSPCSEIMCSVCNSAAWGDAWRPTSFTTLLHRILQSTAKHCNATANRTFFAMLRNWHARGLESRDLGSCTLCPLQKFTLSSSMLPPYAPGRTSDSVRVKARTVPMGRRPGDGGENGPQQPGHRPKRG
jgi:hypothetical protein